MTTQPSSRAERQQAELDALWSKTWPGRAGLPMENYTTWQIIKFFWKAAWLGYYG